MRTFAVTPYKHVKFLLLAMVVVMGIACQVLADSDGSSGSDDTDSSGDTDYARMAIVKTQIGDHR